MLIIIISNLSFCFYCLSCVGSSPEGPTHTVISSWQFWSIVFRFSEKTVFKSEIIILALPWGQRSQTDGISALILISKKEKKKKLNDIF